MALRILDEKPPGFRQWAFRELVKADSVPGPPSALTRARSAL